MERGKPDIGCDPAVITAAVVIGAAGWYASMMNRFERLGGKAPCAFCPVFVDSGDHRKYVLNAYDSSAGTSAFFEGGKKRVLRGAFHRTVPGDRKA